MKFKSNMSFCLDFLRNFNLYGTSIWESMSSGRQKKLMKLTEGKVSTWGQKIGKKSRKIENSTSPKLLRNYSRAS